MEFKTAVTFNDTISQHFTIAKWAGKGFWAVADQGLFATSNFIVNILLARWLSPTEYGTFAVAYTIFLFLSSFHTAMLNEPMIVFGPGKYKPRIKEYLRVLILGHWVSGFFIGTIFFLAYLVSCRFTVTPLTQMFIGLSLASPFLLFNTLMRRACYIDLQPRIAALAGVGYMMLIIFGAWGLYHFAILGPVTALLIMAIASLLSGVWILFKIGIHLNTSKNNGLKRDAFADHWRYGKWALGTAVLAWIPDNVCMLFLPIWWGLEASAAYKALLNLLAPMLNLSTALGAILLPYFVVKKTSPGFERLIVCFLIPLVLGAILYWVILGVFGEPIINFLYSGNYSDYVGLLWLIGIIPIVIVLVTILGGALRALELSKRIFLVYLASSGLALIIGFLFVKSWGIVGAMIGWLSSNIVTGILMAGMLATFLRFSKIHLRKVKEN